MATSFDVTGLTAYTQGNPQKALEVMILTGKGTKDIFSVETGVKYRDKITDITNVDVDISTGKISGYNTGSGATTVKEIAELDGDVSSMVPDFVAKRLKEKFASKKDGII